MFFDKIPKKDFINGRIFGMKKQTPDELEKIQQAILEREIEEELQKERLMEFWKKYRYFIVGGVFAIILSVVGTDAYYAWHKKVRIAESDRFEQAVVQNATGKSSEALAILDTLSKEAKTDYKYLAQLKIAGIQLKSDKQQALEQLKSVFENKSAPQALRAIASLSYVGHQIDVENKEPLFQILNPFLNPINPYFEAATELKVALLLNQDKKEEAKQALAGAILNPNLTDATKERLNSLLSSIK